MSEVFFQLLSRVRTFKIGWWPYTDNDQLSPYILASQGYALTKPYTLECCVCHNIVKVPFQLQQKSSQTLQQLKKHKQNCIFHPSIIQSSQSPITKQKIYLIMDEIITQLKASFSQTIKQIPTYPILKQNNLLNLIDGEKFTLKFINQAYKLSMQKQLNVDFFMQMFCWKMGKKSQDNYVVECLMCGRQVKLNEFAQRQKTSQPKDMEMVQAQAFDLVNQHRYFCLWVNKKCSGYTGWQIFLQHTYDKIIQSKSLFSKRLPEQTKKIRVELDKYLETFTHKTSQQFEKIKNIFSQCQQMKKQIQDQISKQQEMPSNLRESAQRRMNQFLDDINSQFKQKLKRIKLD